MTLPFQTTVPGSSANLGPGFDSVGLAVNRYLTLTVTEGSEWHFSTQSADLVGIPSGKENLVYQVAEHVASQLEKTLPPCHVQMESNIPLARGLGSSAAAIVAGIELANQLLGQPLAAEDKVRFGSLWEGHPDNIAPSVYGGLVIGTHLSTETHVIHGGVPDLDLVLLVPKEELLTKKARGILPESLSYKEAVRGSSVSNVLVAALLKENWELVGEMMVRDVFHHPYRLGLVPHLQEVIRYVKEETEAYGAALSGAGPTMLCLSPKGRGEWVQKQLQKQYPQFEVDVLKPDDQGIQVHRVLSNQQQLPIG